MKKYLILLRREDEDTTFKFVQIETACSNFDEALAEAREKVNRLLLSQKMVYEIDTIARV
jgi:hypothetical protein